MIVIHDAFPHSNNGRKRRRGNAVLHEGLGSKSLYVIKLYAQFWSNNPDAIFPENLMSLFLREAGTKQTTEKEARTW